MVLPWAYHNERIPARRRSVLQQTNPFLLPIHPSSNPCASTNAAPPRWLGFFRRAPGLTLPFGPLTKNEGVKRRKALVRNAAPRGPPYGWGRSLQRKGSPASNVGRRASRRFTAAFLLRRRAALSSGHCPGSSASSWRAARSGQPGGAPTPPECVVASHARGRRILLHLQMPHESAPR